LPLIVEESLYEIVNMYMGIKYLKEELEWNDNIKYPLISDLPKVGDRILTMRGYDKEVESNIKAALRTRVNALTVGWKGDIFNIIRSTPYEELFDKKVVINLNRIGDDRDKSLIISLLLISLSEYRQSRYRVDKEYKERANGGKLCHASVIEEAHRLLKNVSEDSVNGNPQAAVSNMFCEMLSEIRAYGEGLLIVDQVPARLIPDAIKNTNLKIVHRIVARDDREALSSCMGLRQEQEDTIAILQQGQAIICGDNDDAASWIKIAATN
jgi:DNA helicase HerA-like ATPase